MAEGSEKTNKPDEGALDLSSLSSMSLGPDWVSGKKPQTQFPKTRGEDRPRGPRPPRKDGDRRGPPPKRRPEHGERRGREERTERQPFEPVVEVDFYPEEEPFRVLSQAIRNSCRTFELFEIARLILEKPDRFVCVVRDPGQKEGDPARLYASVPDGLPFRSEEEALGHTMRHYLADFFTIETVEGEAPTGSFQVVHKCGFTGDLLAPPNYHRYQALCREHHAAKLAHMPYTRFEQRIESTREEEDIQKWLEQMKQQTRYTSKEDPSMVFGNLEDARLYLITQAKDKLVRPAYSARFSGKALALLNPGDPIRRSVEILLEGQRKFPLVTANHLRGRLRRMHFAVYKRGSKGVSYVCAVKRRFRKPDEVLADNLQELIDFIEAHPNFPAKELPKGFLGIDPQRKVTPPAAPTEAGKEMAAEVAPGESGEGATAEAEGAETAPEEAAKPAPAEAEVKELSAAEQSAIRQLKNDLHYLVSEGYVTEYSDGRLFVPPIREEEIRHAEKQKEQKEKTAPAEASLQESEPVNSPEGETGTPGTEPARQTPTVEAPAGETESPETPPEVSGAEVPEPEAEKPEAAQAEVPEPLPEEESTKPEGSEPEVQEATTAGGADEPDPAEEKENPETSQPEAEAEASKEKAEESGDAVKRSEL